MQTLSMSLWWRVVAIGMTCGGLIGSDHVCADPPRVLVYSRTTGFRHASIPAGIEAIQNLGDMYGFEVDATEDPALFTDTQLANYNAVVFLQTTGNPLVGAQRAAFEQFIQAGNGFVGVHSSADVDGSWPWYVSLLGARFLSHPAIQTATIDVVDADHRSTRHLGPTWQRQDEWYNYQSLSTNLQTLLELDETTYSGGTMGATHPIAWYQHFEGGRSWYTGGGHTSGTYSEPAFLAHLAGGILWAAFREGDYNRDGLLDAADYVVWRASAGDTGLGLPADGDGDGEVGPADLALWQANFSPPAAATGMSAARFVPEPGISALVGSLSLFVILRRPPRAKRRR